MVAHFIVSLSLAALLVDAGTAQAAPKIKAKPVLTKSAAKPGAGASSDRLA